MIFQAITPKRKPDDAVDGFVPSLSAFITSANVFAFPKVADIVRN